MGLHKKYLITYEGPFGKTELEEQIKELNEVGWDWKLWDYDIIQGETKSGSDEEIINIARKSTPIQIMKRYDSDFWEKIWSIKDNPPEELGG